MVGLNYKELNNCYRVINNWYKKKSKVLSIRTRPFNTFYIFSDIINKALNYEDKILYIWCTDNKEYIKEKEEEFYNKVLKNNLNKRINFIHYSKVEEIDEEYDLVIYDDITLFSNIRTDRIRDLVEKLYWKSRKIIIYSFEYIFPIGEKYNLVYLLNPIPIIEPRILKTRINLEDDIPLAVFDYFKWFKENKKNVLIIVPSDNHLKRVYQHYYTILKSYNMRLVQYYKNQKFKFIEDIIEGYNESLFIATTNIGEYIKRIPNLNIVILFSDNEYFTYKKIVNICAAVDNYSTGLSEVLMVCKEVSQDMDKAKDITRKLNRVLWEKKLLK